MRSAALAPRLSTLTQRPTALTGPLGRAALSVPACARRVGSRLPPARFHSRLSPGRRVAPSQQRRPATPLTGQPRHAVTAAARGERLSRLSLRVP